MDRLQAMTIFVAVAEEASFAGGARRLRLSPPAVTRAVAALEDKLGVRLLIRTTRSVRVSEAGARYLEDARRIVAEIDEADEAAAGINAAPRGHLAVTAPALFGCLYVMPVIAEYLERHPEVTASALLVDRVVNLVDEGLDVGVRLGDLPDSSLQAIRVGEVRRVVCGAPSYLAAHGAPETPEDLRRHCLVASTAVSPNLEWQFAGPQGNRTVKVAPRLQVNSNDGAIAAALGGLGLVRQMSYQVAGELAAGRLTRLLADYEPPPLPVHVVHREGRRGSAKVRAFVDLVVDRLRRDPALA